jgi:hypothetical protein
MVRIVVACYHNKQGIKSTETISRQVPPQQMEGPVPSKCCLTVHYHLPRSLGTERAKLHIG